MESRHIHHLNSPLLLPPTSSCTRAMSRRRLLRCSRRSRTRSSKRSRPLNRIHEVLLPHACLFSPSSSLSSSPSPSLLSSSDDPHGHYGNLLLQTRQSWGVPCAAASPAWEFPGHISLPHRRLSMTCQARQRKPPIRPGELQHEARRVYLVESAYGTGCTLEAAAGGVVTLRYAP